MDSRPQSLLVGVQIPLTPGPFGIAGCKWAASLPPPLVVQIPLRSNTLGVAESEGPSTTTPLPCYADPADTRYARCCRM